MKEINESILIVDALKKDPALKGHLDKLEELHKSLTASNTNADKIESDLKESKASYSELQKDYISLVKGTGFKGKQDDETPAPKKTRSLEKIIAELTKKGK